MGEATLVWFLDLTWFFGVPLVANSRPVHSEVYVLGTESAEGGVVLELLLSSC